MKKRLLALLLVILTFCTVCLIFSACNVASGNHEHRYSDEYSYNETRHWYAAICGCKNKGSEIEHHTFSEWVVVKNEDCVNDGVKKRSCVCGYSEQLAIPSIGQHVASDWIIDVEPTCVLDGTKYKECPGCHIEMDREDIPATGIHTYSNELSYDDNYHWYETTCGCEDVTMGKEEHNFVNGKCVCGQVNYSVGLTYEKVSNYYKVTGIGNCLDKNLVIPPYYNGLVVKEIAAWAFYENENITSVSIPRTLTTLGDCAFAHCLNVTSYSVEDGSNSFSTINGDLYNKDGTMMLQYAIGKKDTTFTIPSSVKVIDDDTFRCSYNLINVVIPYGVERIGGWSFYNCTNLNNLNIPDSVKDIGWGAFVDCDSFTRIKVPDKVEWIGLYMFAYCNKLREVELGTGVKYIEREAFSYSPQLATIIIKDKTNWYRVDNETDWRNKTNGTYIDLSNLKFEASYFGTTYKNYYWYKK